MRKIKEKLRNSIKSRENTDKLRIKYYFYHLAKSTKKFLIIKSISIIKTFVKKMRLRNKLFDLSRKILINAITSLLKTINNIDYHI